MTAADGLHVAVLSCSSLGARVAGRLREVNGVAQVTLVTTPYRRRTLGIAGKLLAVWRQRGPAGLAVALAAKARRLTTGRGTEAPGDDSVSAPAGVVHLRFDDFHHPFCVDELRRLRPDLGVVAGTYLLREPVFSIPRLGSINLHSGKAPEYRGSAPAFWEMMNGEREVGVTIHRVTAGLDAGHILRQEMFPLDPAPEGDPLEYLERYRNSVLQENGVRMLAEVVSQIAAGTAREAPQDPARARTWGSPDWRAVRELRRRVRERRRAGATL